MERRNTIFLYILWDDQKTWSVCFFQASGFWGFVYFLRIKKSQSVKIDGFIWNIYELCKILQTIIFTFINAITFSQCGKQNQSTLLLDYSQSSQPLFFTVNASHYGFQDIWSLELSARGALASFAAFLHTATAILTSLGFCFFACLFF